MGAGPVSVNTLIMGVREHGGLGVITCVGDFWGPRIQWSLGSFPLPVGVPGGALSLGSPQFSGNVRVTYLYRPEITHGFPTAERLRRTVKPNFWDLRWKAPLTGEPL